MRPFRRKAASSETGRNDCGCGDMFVTVTRAVCPKCTDGSVEVMTPDPDPRGIVWKNVDNPTNLQKMYPQAIRRDANPDEKTRCKCRATPRIETYVLCAICGMGKEISSPGVEHG